MTLELVDFSFARPTGAAIAGAGKSGVIRYLTGAGKALTPAEVADYHAHGLAIALVFEGTGAASDVDTKAEGVRDGKLALSAMTTLGIPVAIPVYFAFDFNATPAQQPAIDAYLWGAASVLGAARIGVYGGIGVITRCHTNGSAKYFWQTYAWSGGKIAPFIHLYQYQNGQKINGGWVDFCRAYRANYGQWPQPVISQTAVIDRRTELYAYRAPGHFLPYGGVVKGSFPTRRVPADFYRIVIDGKTLYLAGLVPRSGTKTPAVPQLNVTWRLA